MPAFVVRVSHHGVDELPFVRAAPSSSELHEEEGKNVQVKREKWAWDVQKTALHDASQLGGPLLFGSNEPLLRKISEEVTREAQKRVKRSFGNEESRGGFYDSSSL